MVQRRWDLAGDRGERGGVRPAAEPSKFSIPSYHKHPPAERQTATHTHTQGIWHLADCEVHTLHHCQLNKTWMIP